MDFALNNVFRKIFVIKSYNVVNECIIVFNCSVSDAIYKIKIKFLTNIFLNASFSAKSNDLI